MRASFDNKVISSFLLYLDNIILTTGQGYTNASSLFYPISGNISPYYVYAAPYRPFVSDSSIPGATVISGVYLDNSFITTGQSGFVDINYEKGLLYFSSVVTNSISGNYAVKDFSLSLTDKPESKLLFETKHFLRPKVGSTITGLSFDSITYPIIYLRPNGGENEEFALGGLEETPINIRAIIMADSLFDRDAVGGILKDRARSLIGLFESSDMPFNSLGGFKSGKYNYNSIISGKIGANETFFLKRARLSTFSQENLQDLDALNSDVFVSLIDFEICSYRNPRE